VMPIDASSLTRKLQCLQLPMPHLLFGIDFPTIFGFLIIPSVLAGVYMTMIIHRMEKLQGARDSLCKGDTSVLVAI